LPAISPASALPQNKKKKEKKGGRIFTTCVIHLSHNTKKRIKKPGNGKGKFCGVASLGRFARKKESREGQH